MIRTTASSYAPILHLFCKLTVADYVCIGLASSVSINRNHDSLCIAKRVHIRVVFFVATKLRMRNAIGMRVMQTQ